MLYGVNHDGGRSRNSLEVGAHPRSTIDAADENVTAESIFAIRVSDSTIVGVPHP